ncbi:MAG: hypothetical protein H6658_13745 [Ardenticatenaceae bacterium]|nr:hypothetical protein [Ardenticatenaceae bacterium]
MEVLLTNLVQQLYQQRSFQQLLETATAVYHQHLQTAVTLTCALVPETGGIPILPPLCAGEMLKAHSLSGLTLEGAISGTLGDLIRYWQPYFEPEAQRWAAARQPADLPLLLRREGVESFVFLPIAYQERKLALVLLLFREKQAWSEAWRQSLAASALLVSSFMAGLGDNGRYQHKRMATAHTVYGNVANLLRGQLDALEGEILHALNFQLPAQLQNHLAQTKAMAFEEMRRLILEASGDLLVDLREMSLMKALITATAALERAWPQGQRIEIEIAPIPKMIEQQPPLLRELLYTLVLEAIGNAIKHGGPASYVHVGLRWEQNQIYVQVIDHGCGFDKGERPFSPYGLGYWHTHITQYLGGQFQVSSQPGFGTVINAHIPVIPTSSKR